MNSSNKPNVVPGIFLMLLAAFFSLALILQVFDFGSFAPGQDNIFYFFGKILISVYGFTSSLIPLFLLLASLSCFASKWTAKKSMMLLTAVIPFFLLLLELKNSAVLFFLLKRLIFLKLKLL